MKQQTTVITLLLAVCCGCGGPSAALNAATKGSSSAGVPPSPASYDVQLVFSPVGAGSQYTARLDDRAYSTPGAFTVKLSTETHEISGSFRGAGLVVGFAAIDLDGGVQSGSLISQTGPSPAIATCSITYSNSDTSGDPRNFRFQFQVTDRTASTCRGPVP